MPSAWGRWETRGLVRKIVDAEFHVVDDDANLPAQNTHEPVLQPGWWWKFIMFCICAATGGALILLSNGDWPFAR